MEALRAAFESLGFRRVETFIASGNVIFETRSTSEPALTRRIEARLIDAFGFRVDAIIRSEAEVAAIARREPFSSQPIPGAATYITLLSGKPGAAARRAVADLRHADVAFHLHDRELYLHCRPSMQVIRVSTSLLDKTFAGGTMRNANTLRRLAAKLEARNR